MGSLTFSAVNTMIEGRIYIHTCQRSVDTELASCADGEEVGQFAVSRCKRSRALAWSTAILTLNRYEASEAGQC